MTHSILKTLAIALAASGIAASAGWGRRPLTARADDSIGLLRVRGVCVCVCSPPSLFMCVLFQKYNLNDSKI